MLPVKLLAVLICIFTLVLSPVNQGVAQSRVMPEAGPASSAPYKPGELIAGLADGVDIQALRLPSGARLLNAGPELSALGVAVISVPAGMEESYRQKLRDETRFLFVEPNYRVDALDTIPNDPLWGPSSYTGLGQWGPVMVQAPLGWDTTTGSAETILAVIDSGLDTHHPEFSGRIFPGYDYVQNDSVPQDACGHGTHVAGIAAANSNNGIGIAGINWNTRIMPIRVLDRECSGWMSDVAKGLVLAVDKGARVINLSLGGTASSRLLEYSTYYAYRRGAAVIASAGNTGGALTYPARYPWVLAVGAVTSSGALAAYSSSGPELDLVAPGDDVLSTIPYQNSFYFQQVYGLGNRYGLLSGTSMAAPHVAGAAALLAGQGPFDHPAKIYAALTRTALDLGPAGFDANFGWGLLQIADALAFDPSGINPPVPPQPVIEYDALSSSRCQNIPYAWREIDHSFSNALPIFGNDGFTTVDLPFTFNYGGRNFTRITVSANGYLDFEGRGGEKENFLIPVPDEGPPYQRPNWFLAPFWDDLNPSASPNSRFYTATLGSAPSREYVVEWYRIPIQAHNQTTQLTFQVVLVENTGEIIFQYRTLSGAGSDGSSATVGIEYNEGNTGIQYAYNQIGAVKPGMAIHFYRRVPGIPRSTPNCQMAVPAQAGQNYDFGRFCLNLPASLPLADPSTLRMTLFENFPPAPARWLDLHHYAEITLAPMPQAPLDPPAVVCYRYTAADLLKAGGDPHNLFLAVYDSETNFWEKLPTVVNEAAHRLEASVMHFSVFGVYASPQPRSLPVTGAAQAPNSALWLVGGLLIGVAIWGFAQRSSKKQNRK